MTSSVVVGNAGQHQASGGFQVVGEAHAVLGAAHQEDGEALGFAIFLVS